MKKSSLNKYLYLTTVLAVLIVAVAVYTQQKLSKDESKSHKNCPIMKQEKSQTSETDKNNQTNHSDYFAMVLKNGEKAMGFSQTATTHHFLLMKNGGAIQVEANDAEDLENRDKVRKHLAEIAEQFKKGIFTTPLAVHGQVPPGVSVMDQLRNEINYSYEETEKGARVRIITDNSQALAAIHQFLKFQIEDHQTGDPLRVGN